MKALRAELPKALSKPRPVDDASRLAAPECAPITEFLHFSGGAGATLQQHSIAAPPPVADGSVRVVCIADTHNEHASLHLPAGDVLIHAGDCLTESGERHVRRSGATLEVRPAGVELFVSFASWLARQPHAHKVLIGGNHDLVLEALGAARVQQILDEQTPDGVEPPIYLEHTAASVGGLIIFGSPYAAYGGKNLAFFARSGADFAAVPSDADVVVTHMPCVLPDGDGSATEDARLADALRRAKAQLHVAGHCHWAHGLHRTRAGIASVVASASGPHYHVWSSGELRASTGWRGDARDAASGGYNVTQLPIACDVRVRAWMSPQGG